MADSDSYTLEIVQGETYERTFTFKDDGVTVPLEGLDIRSQLRAKNDSTSQLICNLTDYITVNGDSATLRLPGSVTAAFSRRQIKATVDETQAAWDLFLVNAADPTDSQLRIQGPVVLDPSATQMGA